MIVHKQDSTKMFIDSLEGGFLTEGHRLFLGFKDVESGARRLVEFTPEEVVKIVEAFKKPKVQDSVVFKKLMGINE